MELLSTWHTLYKLRYCPVTLIQIAFSAGTVYLLIAMQASSGAHITRKELRHSLDQEILVQQYLQEIGLSWNCATNISATLRNFMNEQVRPPLDLLDRKNIFNTASLHTPADKGDDEESNTSRSHSSSRKRSSVTTLAPQISHPYNFQPLSSPSSENNHVDAYLGMLDGQAFSEAPFVGLLNEVEDSRSPNSSTFLGGASFETGFPN